MDNNIKADCEALSASLGTLYDCECIYIKNGVGGGSVGWRKALQAGSFPLG
jgi:hypothetical protein